MSDPVKPPTLADVARIAGVSVPTASRALNPGIRGSSSGSAELRERVRAAARKLGYAANPAAQTTKGGRARTIALLVSDLDDFGSATMISGFMRAAEECGLSLAVRATHDDAERERELLSRLRGECHRAVVIATSRSTDAAREKALAKQLRVLDAEGTRIVVVGDNSLGFPAVTIDNRAAARRLAEALAISGARRFALISGPADEVTAREREVGFLEGLAVAGIAATDVRIAHRPFSRDGGYSAVDELADALPGLEVIAAMSDAMAVGAIARMRELGVPQPGQIEVTGFDHVPMLGDVLPGFSTVEVPLDRFGEAALALAFGDDRHRTSIALPSVTIVRGVALNGPLDAATIVT